MISTADLLFLSGLSLALVGCWLLGLPHGLVGTGVAVCVAAVVVGRIQVARRRTRR